MKSEHFKIKRADGRSYSEVLVGHVSQGDYGKVYEYDELQKVLDVESKERVIGIVPMANKRLLRNHSKSLRNVRNVGYKICHPSEHAPLAIDRRRRASNQMKRGVELLQHVDWDALDENTKAMHQGQLMIMQGVYSMVSHNSRRIDRLETLTNGVIQG